MAWYLKYYYCRACRLNWSDEWDCLCDDVCPGCGKAHEVLHYEDIEADQTTVPTPRETVRQVAGAVAITMCVVTFLHSAMTGNIVVTIGTLLLGALWCYGRKLMRNENPS